MLKFYIFLHDFSELRNTLLSLFSIYKCVLLSVHYVYDLLASDYLGFCVCV